MNSQKRLLVIMPALNEAATISDVISRIPRKIDGIDQVEVLVVDDGSTDDTSKLAQAAGADTVRHISNRGVGAAIKTGLQEAISRKVDYVVNIDSDGQFNPDDIPVLLKPIIDGEADFVTASRFKDLKLKPKMPYVKYLGNLGVAKIVSTLSGNKFYDVSCGFRAYSRETLLRLVLLGKFTYTHETLLVLSNLGMTIKEMPIAVRGEREFGKSRVASNLFKYAFSSLGIMFASIRDFKPNVLFNNIAFLLFSVAIGFFCFLAWHRVTSGQFTPHIWSGFLGAFLFGLGLLTIIFGQIALMLARIRLIQEEQLYLLRKMTGKDPS